MSTTTLPPWCGGTVDEVAAELRGQVTHRDVLLDGDTVRAAAIGMIRGTAYRTQDPAVRCRWIDTILDAAERVSQELLP